MSLKSFHIFFVVASIALSSGFGYWALRVYPLEAGPGTDREMLYLGIGSLVAAALLMGYLAWLGKKFRRLSAFGLLLLVQLLTPQTSLACSVCYGDPKSPLTQSANSGIVAMLAVVGVVLAGFATVFSVWWRNARRIEGL